jgi:hypothetical protein
LLSTVAHEARNGNGKPLGRLNELRTTDSINSQAILQNFVSFFSLPNLRVIRGFEYLASNDQGTSPYLCKFEWTPDYTMSALETIEMAQSCVSGREPNLASLLAHTPRLRSFKLDYSHNVQYGIGCDWDVSAVFRALEKYCSGTIVRLSITIDQLPGTIMAGLQSLQQFIRLEYLELDVRQSDGCRSD